MPSVSIKPSSAALNTIDVTIDGEGHTLGSSLAERLNATPACEYAAYRKDHPFDTHITLRVKGNDTQNAKDVLCQAISGMIKDVDSLINQLHLH